MNSDQFIWGDQINNACLHWHLLSQRPLKHFHLLLMENDQKGYSGVDWMNPIVKQRS